MTAVFVLTGAVGLLQAYVSEKRDIHATHCPKMRLGTPLNNIKQSAGHRYSMYV